jgi:hypothetical protein
VACADSARSRVGMIPSLTKKNIRYCVEANLEDTSYLWVRDGITELVHVCGESSETFLHRR